MYRLHKVITSNKILHSFKMILMSTDQKKIRFSFAGGGTGGHVFPIKTLINYMQNDNSIQEKCEKIFWFGCSGSLEEKIARQQSGITFFPIFAGKRRRIHGFLSYIYNVLDLFRFLFGIIQSIVLIWTNRIDIVFCKGGYVALPVVIAGFLLRKKVFMHESDTVPGLVNKIAYKFSTISFTGFPGIFANEVCVGQILSPDLLSFNNPKEHFFSPTTTNVLVVGGSQGSRFLLDTLLSEFEEHHCLYENYRFIIVIGINNNHYKEKFSRFENIECKDFVSQQEMGMLGSLADLAITRGGATSLAELKLFGNKLIVIPLPYTGGNHQFTNGLYYEKHYGDTVILQNEETQNNLHRELSTLLKYKKPMINKEKLMQQINITTKNILEKIFTK